MSDIREHAAKLAEIGNRLADELSIMAHTKGITRKAQDALDEWDPAVIYYRHAEREAR